MNENDEPLTNKEATIEMYILKCKTRPEIADILEISEDTVHTHCRSIYKKRKVKNKAELFTKRKDAI